MLRGNLSTRPFYNERLVSLIVIVGTLLGIVLTVFSVTTIYGLSGERTKQRAEQDRNVAEAARIRAEADRVQSSVDRSNLLMLAGATREANSLIDQRTFSWTVFFGLVEKTMPLDARLMSVAPRVDRGVFKIVMFVNVKDQTDIETFLDNLTGTGSFYDLLIAEQQRNEDGTLTARLTSSYVAPGAGAPGAGVQPSARKGTDRP